MKCARIRVVLVLAGLAVPALAQGWSASTPVAVLNTTAADTGPHLSADGLTLHLSSFRAGNWEIFSSTRATTTSPWTTPVQETAIGLATAVDDQPFLTADGLELWFSSNRPGGARSSDIWMAARATPASPWGAPVFVSALSGTLADSSPTLTDDKLEFYMLSTSLNSPGINNNALVKSTRPSVTAPWSPLAIVTELFTPNTHRDVAVSGDGLTLWYTEYFTTLARTRVLQSKRLHTALPWDPPVPLAEFDAVGTSIGVYSFSPSASGNEVFLAANNPAAAGSQEIMTARFEGLTATGSASPISSLSLHYRDGARPGWTYVLAASLGNTGFAFGPFTIPIDPDFVFALTLATDIPPYTAGFSGILDAQGEATATVTDPSALLTGITLYFAGATADPLGPFPVAFVTNAVQVLLQ